MNRIIFKSTYNTISRDDIIMTFLPRRSARNTANVYGAYFLLPKNQRLSGKNKIKLREKAT